MPESIEISDGLLLTGDGAAWLPSLRAIVVADVHVGYARAARRRGGYLPEAEDVETVVARVAAAAARVGAERVVVAGDLRHSTRDADEAELDDVARFVREVEERIGRVDLVAGNHDRGARDMARSIRLGDVEVVHEPPREAPDHWVVAGHLHPSTTVRDETGAGARFPCALVGRALTGPRVLVLPAFTEWAGGTAVRRLRRVLPPGEWRVLPVAGGEVYEMGSREWGVGTS